MMVMMMNEPKSTKCIFLCKKSNSFLYSGAHIRNVHVIFLLFLVPSSAFASKTTLLTSNILSIICAKYINGLPVSISSL